MVSVHGCPLVTPGMRSAGGMSVYLRQIAPLLAARGICVDIFTRGHEASGPEVLDIGPGVRVIHVAGGPEVLPKERVPPYLPQIFQTIRARLDAEGLGYDLVHSHYWLSGWVGTQLAQHLGVPHVVTFHTNGLIKEAAFEASEPLVRKVAEARMADSADHVLAFTHEEASTLQRLHGLAPQQLHVTPGGVDLNLFRPTNQVEARERTGLDQDANIILYVGRLEPFKAPDILMRALEQLPNTRLMVVGGGQEDEDRAWLRAIAGEVGVMERVSWHSAMPQNMLPDYYAAANLLVVPSFHESFGLVALEAMACGTPVVAARVGGLESAVVDGITGRLVDSHEPSAYAICIRTLLADDEQREAMGRSAAQWAASFGWESSAAALLRAYEGVAAQVDVRREVIPCYA